MDNTSVRQLLLARCRVCCTSTLRCFALSACPKCRHFSRWKCQTLAINYASCDRSLASGYGVAMFESREECLGKHVWTAALLCPFAHVAHATQARLSVRVPLRHLLSGNGEGVAAWLNQNVNTVPRYVSNVSRLGQRKVSSLNSQFHSEIIGHSSNNFVIQFLEKDLSTVLELKLHQFYSFTNETFVLLHFLVN